jgi:prevent-host-death family protein
MAKPVNIADAKARLPALVERAAHGEEIVIARNGQPRARLVPLRSRVQRVPGHGAGKWRVSQDFNDPLPPSILAAFEGRRQK